VLVAPCRIYQITTFINLSPHTKFKQYIELIVIRSTFVPNSIADKNIWNCADTSRNIITINVFRRSNVNSLDWKNLPRSFLVEDPIHTLSHFYLKPMHCTSSFTFWWITFGLSGISLVLVNCITNFKNYYIFKIFIKQPLCRRTCLMQFTGAFRFCRIFI
jgi:hypothetical protein